MATPAAKAKRAERQRRQRLAARIAQLKSQGKSWDEIIKATKVKGPITGRNLMREFGYGDGIRKSDVARRIAGDLRARAKLLEDEAKTLRTAADLASGKAANEAKKPKG